MANQETETTHSNVFSLHHSEIFIDERIRSDPGNLSEFAEQLRKEGQQNPITFEVTEVDGVQRRVLNTGFRRLASAGVLSKDGKFFGMDLPEGNPRRVSGPGHVLARDIGTLSELERILLELSENDGRQGFSDSERALGYAKLKRLIERTEGRTVRVAELAKMTNESVGQVGMGLKVAKSIEDDPTSELSKRLIRAPSVKAAYQTLTNDTKLSELKARAAKANIRPEHEDNIKHSDGIAFLKGLEKESVDFIFFDPPWGIEHDSYQRHDKHERYDDNEDRAWKTIIEPMIPELYRVAKTDTWGVVWCGIQFAGRMTALLEKAGFKVNPIPNIWFKPNKKGSQGDASRIETNVYEIYLRIAKGEPRLFKKPVTNHLSFDMDTHDERDHSAQKPIPLCKEILERYTFGSMHIIDPTYGSGRIFKAAKILGRTFAGAELSETNREFAINLLRRLD